MYRFTTTSASAIVVILTATYPAAPTAAAQREQSATQPVTRAAPRRPAPVTEATTQKERPTPAAPKPATPSTTLQRPRIDAVRPQTKTPTPRVPEDPGRIADCVRKVPNVVNTLPETARSTLHQYGLTLGDIQKRVVRSGRGLIVGQTPGAGGLAKCGTSVSVVVDYAPSNDDVGPVLCTVPRLSGGLEDVRRQLGKFPLGRVTPTTSNGDSGVIRQHPEAGAQVKCDTRVEVWIATPPQDPGGRTPEPEKCTTRVPRLSGLVDAATAMLGGSRLRLGRVQQRPISGGASTGFILEQRPQAGAVVDCNTAVDVVIALVLSIPPPEPKPPVERCTVPNLTGRAAEDVTEMVRRAGLRIGKVGTKRSEHSFRIVLDQSPNADKQVRCDSEIDLVVAEPTRPRPVEPPPLRPPQPPEPPDCRVPNLAGSDIETARQAIASTNLVLVNVNQRQADRRPGTVIEQAPAAGTLVKCRSQVDLWIASQPPAPSCPPVPSLIGQNSRTAAAVLESTTFSIGNVATRESDQPGGVIVDQSPRAGVQARCGSAIAVWVAGPVLVRVPPIVGQSAAAARETLTAAGLALSDVQQRTVEAQPDSIVEQAPAAGTLVTRGSGVQVWVAVPPVIRVPDVRGGDRNDAAQELSAVKLQLGPVGQLQSDEPVGKVVDQTPKPGATVRQGTPVQIWVAVERVTNVPNLRGRKSSDAAAALTAVKLQLGPVLERQAEDPVGTIVDQTPKPGATVKAGTAVQVWTAVPITIDVPNLAGTDRGAAADALAAVKLRLGDVTARQSDAAKGTVVDQTPRPGMKVSPGTPVHVSVAIPVSVEVPDLRGQDQGRAAETLTGRRLRIGQIAERTSDAPRGTIVDQVPGSGELVTAQTVVNVWLAVPRRVQVPDLGGRDEAYVRSTLTRRGLSVGTIRQREARGPAGTVIEQQPAAGATVDAGTSVAVWLALTAVQEIPPVEVPDVSGLPRADAERVITERGLAMGGTTETESGAMAPGSVLRQQPAGGALVAQGTSIDLVLAVAAPPPPAPATPPSVLVPSVAGLAVADAHAVLRAAGLEPRGLLYARAWAAPGTVTGQSLAAGSRAAAGSTIDLVAASSLGLFLGGIAGLIGGVAAAATASKVRGRQRVPSSVTLAPHADAGVQVTMPDHGPEAEFEISLQGFPDAGLQTLQVLAPGAADAR